MRRSMKLLATEWPKEYPAGALEWLLVERCLKTGGSRARPRFANKPSSLRHEVFHAGYQIQLSIDTMASNLCIAKQIFPNLRTLLFPKGVSSVAADFVCPDSPYGETPKSAGKIDQKAVITVEVPRIRPGQSLQQQLRSLRLHRFQLRKVCGTADQQGLRSQQQKGRHRNHAASHQKGTHHRE
jgi:hypothetical protein